MIRYLNKMGILSDKENFKIFKSIVLIANHNGYKNGLEFAKQDYLKRKGAEVNAIQKQVHDGTTTEISKGSPD